VPTPGEKKHNTIRGVRIKGKEKNHRVSVRRVKKGKGYRTFHNREKKEEGGEGPSFFPFPPKEEKKETVRLRGER